MLFWGLSSLWWCYSQIVTWKQEITNLWNRSGEIGNRIPGSCSASKNLTTSPSLFQSAWQHHSISVNHACQVSGFWGESPDLLKMTTDDGFGNNYHKQWLLLIKDKQRLCQPFYCHKSTYMMKIWSKLGVYELPPPIERSERGSPPPPFVGKIVKFSANIRRNANIFVVQMHSYKFRN